MTAHLKTLAAGLMLALLTAGCSQPTSVIPTWHTSRANAGSYDKILVVGITENGSRRRSFEDYVVRDLERRGNTAWASSRHMDVTEPLDRASVLQVVEQLGADAVVATRLINQEVTAQSVDARTGVKTQRKNERAVDFFRYDYNEYEEPAYVTAVNTVTLLTEFHSARDEKRLYSIETTTYEKETIYDILEEVSPKIVKQLGQAGLVR